MNFREEPVAVYGLGKIGLGVVAVLVRSGFRNIVGVDTSREVVERINEGLVDHPDQLVKDTILWAVTKGFLRATIDGIEASRRSRIKIIDVPLTIDSSMKPDYSMIDKALESIAQGLKPGDLVLVETVLPPRAMEDHVKVLLEDVSGLRVEEDFYLAYAPERVMVERIVRDIEESYPRIIAGIGPKSTRLALEFYSLFSRRGVIVASSVRALELARIYEGVYRDVNIALANEYARLAQLLGVDYEEIARLASTNPYVHPHKPGPGVGGMCLPVYPYFALSMGDEYGLALDLIACARRINEEQPEWIVGLVHEASRKLGLESGNTRTCILGLSYRGGVGDIRNSPSIKIIELLLKDGFRSIVVFDPYVDPSTVKSIFGDRVKVASNLAEAIEGSNIVVVLVDHPIFKRLRLSVIKDLCGENKVAVIDAKDIVFVDDAVGVIYVGIGRPWLIN